MSAVIELQDVTKRYGDHTAVERLSMHVEEGERIALLGHNGAGKTTLMKLMLGLVRASAGSVRLFGRDPGALGATRARSRIGFLPESVTFDEALTGNALLRFYGRLKGCPAEECAGLIDRVGLHGAGAARVGTYSKGMRQRLGLAQALLGSPRLLLLDEPTGGLDPALRQRFYEILDTLKQGGAAVVLSSHLLTELEERTERLIIMERGRAIAQGSLGELRERARLPVRFRLAISGDRARVLEHFAQAPDLRESGGFVSFTAPTEEKMSALRSVAELGPLVRDVEVESPSLEDIYAHFVPDEESA